MFAKPKQKMVGSESFQIKWTYWCFMCTQHAMGGLARQGPQVFFFTGVAAARRRMHCRHQNAFENSTGSP